LTVTEELQQRRAADERMPFNGGRLLARALQRLGVKNLFTLSGGHLFSLYDGCVEVGIRIVDTRHEEHAVHAAEGWSKVMRNPGVAAVTAGPGVTNAMTGLASAFYNRSPAIVIGGRAPDMRWGAGSLQEMDHIPMVQGVTKRAATVHDPERVHVEAYDAWQAATTGCPGPAFFDFPQDAQMTPVDEDGVEWPELQDWRPAPDPDLVGRAIKLLEEAERPLVLAGSGVYWHHGEAALCELALKAGLPVYVNGMARGTIPSDHPNAFSRTRGFALGGTGRGHAVGAADLVLLVGTPLDFRLGFGESIPAECKMIRIDYLPEDLERNRVPEVGMSGHIGATLEALAARAGGSDKRQPWLQLLRERESAAVAADAALLESDADPIHPMRVYGEILKFIDRDAIVIGDGGDFVSYAGKLVPTYSPGHFLDPGPFGTLGMGPGAAIAARLAHPDKQILLILGDGAFGFAGLEFDTMVRHHLPVVALVGNNLAWGLEKHPMEMIYGYSVAAELSASARYDKVVEALGGHGELVTSPGAIAPALKRAFDAGVPALINVMTDPSIAYPRQTIPM
jgi:acetolactate synthase-1/2/3 large subunit